MGTKPANGTMLRLNTFMSFRRRRLKEIFKERPGRRN